MLNSIKYWFGVFAINILLFNLLHFLNAQYGDVLGFAFIGSLMYSVPSFIVCYLLGKLFKLFEKENEFSKLLKSLLNLIVCLAVYIIMIHLLDKPFIFQLLNGELSETKNYYFTVLLISIIVSVLIMEIKEYLTNSKPNAPKQILE